MSARRLLLFVFSAVAAVLLVVVFRARRQGGGSPAAGAPPAVPAAPALPPATGTVVRALPPSALAPQSAEAGRPPLAQPSSKDVAAVIDGRDASLEARLAALFAFLDRHDSDDALPPEKLNALKNDATNVLRSQSVLPEVLPWRLAAMWRDPEHDDVWRDYCIQHAGAAWSRIGNLKARGEVRTVLWTAASAPSLPGSGTALIALRNLASSGAEDRAKVADRAAVSAASPDAPEGVRVTALQVAAEAGFDGTAGLARSILASRQNPVHLRMSAAAALGRVGDASELDALDRLAAGSEPRLRAAGSAAAARIRKADQKK
jgi:hypothetical protein